MMTSLYSTFEFLTYSILITACVCDFPYPPLRNPTEHPNWYLVNNGGNCGMSHSQRIIGGTDAGLGKYPWMVRLGFNFGGLISFKCSGSIINKKYVLTANHCFVSQDYLQLVRAGEYDERTNPDCDEYGECAPPYIDYRIEQIIIHPLFDEEKGYDFDITLIRIQGEFEFNDYIMPICLEYGSLLKKDYVGYDVEVAGWGIYDMDINEGYPILQTLTSPVLNEKRCIKLLRRITSVSSKQICIGGKVGKDSCGGDSGGPLMVAQPVDDQPPRYFLIGIVSFGSKFCAKTNMPSIYTRVSSFLIWILNNMSE